MAKIAVLGWGSLIWCPKSLRLGSPWHRGGPLLPIEFARQSKGERVTLVLVPDAKLQPTFWALSEFPELGLAIDNLRDREGARRRDIHWLGPEDEQADGVPPKIANPIRTWLEKHTELGAVIWTGLPPKWEEAVGRCPTPGDVITYLEKLMKREASADAEEYIRNTPKELETDVRELVVQRFGWEHNPLPTTLFSDEPG